MARMRGMTRSFTVLAAAPIQHDAKMLTRKLKTYATTTLPVSIMTRVSGMVRVIEPSPTYTRPLPVRGFSQSDTMPPNVIPSHPATAADTPSTRPASPRPTPWTRRKNGGAQAAYA